MSPRNPWTDGNPYPDAVKPSKIPLAIGVFFVLVLLAYGAGYCGASGS